MHLGAVGEVLFYEAAQLTDVFFRVVVAGNSRDAHPDVAGTFAAQMLQVLQNTSVALTGTLAVLCIVHVLDVVEYDIAELSRAAQNLPGDSAAGFDGSGDAIFPAELQQGECEFRLCEGFAAGNGYAAVIPVEEPVLLNFMEGLSDGNRIAADFTGICRTDRYAGAAAGAECSIGMYFDVSSHRNCSSRAGGEAGSAGDTLVLAVHQLWRTHLGFRIGAPQATQRTALHEHVRAYAGAIVDAEVLDVEDCAFRCFERFCQLHLCADF